MTGLLSSLAIVVVNYGSHELLERNLLGLSLRLPDALIVIVDSFSSWEERREVEVQTNDHGWDLVVTQVNVGFGKGMNLGVRHAASKGFDSYLLLNPDAKIDVCSLKLLCEAVVDEPLTLWCPSIRKPDGTIWFGGADVYLDSGLTMAASRRDPESSRRTRPWLTGAALMVGADLWARCGGFPEEYFLYWEDVEFSYRVQQAGGSLKLLEAATVIHDEGGTHATKRSTSQSKSDIYYYYNIRNRLLYAARTLEEADFRRWKRTVPSSTVEILLRGGRRQFLRPVGPLTAALRGIRDGLRLAREQRQLSDRPKSRFES
ncbi:glycosyltransferase family 2 protein [Arthrobacter alpinus]|uniref:glycosyltransferase family 2 protein n=1 Tax=Arthrobacter alpinus TaxID=656366 RepID=UPI0021BD3069|nr:glycosyltransferase family 2 protein [Arthrobacter alpinus]